MICALIKPAMTNSAIWLINSMRWQCSLRPSEKAERQWVSDTSHELQTPLAVLRAEIEAIQDGVRKPDEKTLATLHQSVLRISSLVQDISQLSFAREGKFGSNFNTENLSEILSQSVQNAQTILNDAGLTVDTRISPDVIAECDHLRIGQLIDNILANAVRYTSSPGNRSSSAVKAVRPG